MVPFLSRLSADFSTVFAETRGRRKLTTISQQLTAISGQLKGVCPDFARLPDSVRFPMSLRLCGMLGEMGRHIGDPRMRSTGVS